jgi:hypothetical protein
VNFSTIFAEFRIIFNCLALYQQSTDRSCGFRQTKMPGSLDTFVSIGRILFSTKRYVPFSYKLSKYGEDFHAVFDRKRKCCYAVIDGKIIVDPRSLEPHPFIENRHNGARSIMQMVYVLNNTLKEWEKDGELHSFTFPCVHF